MLLSHWWCHRNAQFRVWGVECHVISKSQHYEHCFSSASWLIQHFSSPVLKRTKSWTAYPDRNPMYPYDHAPARLCLWRTGGDQTLILEAPHVTLTFLFFSRSACEQCIMITAKAFFGPFESVSVKRLIPYFPQTFTLHPPMNIMQSQDSSTITSVVHTICDEPSIMTRCLLPELWFSKTAQETSSDGKSSCQFMTSSGSSYIWDQVQKSGGV